MTYIDSHSHLYLEAFSVDLPEVIERARQAGVSHILLPNIDSSTLNDMLSVCESYKGYCFPMIGLHPTSVNASFMNEFSVVEEQLKIPGLYVGIGEIGLDLYWDKSFLNEQIMAFDKQIQLALKYDLPVVIHSRDAFEPLFKAMSPYKGTGLKGIFHSFTGNITEAEALLGFDNFLLGINGVITFKNSGLSDVVKEIPVERLAIETDAPYLTPAPFRGKRNESSYLKYTLYKLAETYGRNPEEIAQITSRNVLEVFDKLN